MTTSFNVTSGKVHLTDPCYTRGTWCANWDIPAKNGKWEVQVTEGENGLQQMVFFRHESFRKWTPSERPKITIKVLNDCGVDSGQCGFFDDTIYPKEGDTGDYKDEKSFYGQVSAVGTGVVCVGQGFNCNGFGGDGSFPVRGWFVDDKILIACEIDFGNEEEEEE